MRWSTKQRMNFIAERLHVVGKIIRRDIMERFEVSAPQASADFRTFEREHPGAMRYDMYAKGYVSTMSDGDPKAVCNSPAPPPHAPLMEFYGVETIDDLIAAMERHIARLQSRVPPPRAQSFQSVREG